MTNMNIRLIETRQNKRSGWREDSLLLVFSAVMYLFQLLLLVSAQAPEQLSLGYSRLLLL
jgi:hypothetical protein